MRRVAGRSGCSGMPSSGMPQTRRSRELSAAGSSARWPSPSMSAATAGWCGSVARRWTGGSVHTGAADRNPRARSPWRITAYPTAFSQLNAPSSPMSHTIGPNPADSSNAFSCSDNRMSGCHCCIHEPRAPAGRSVAGGRASASTDPSPGAGAVCTSPRKVIEQKSGRRGTRRQPPVAGPWCS